MNWKTSIIACAMLLTTVSVQAQHSISGYVYEMQSGEPLEGVRILMKNRQGLDIGLMPAIHTDAEGYFEFSNVKPRDYRAEITHTFETADGPMGLRLFTNGDVIAVDTSDYKLNIGLSRYMAEKKLEHLAMSHLHNKARDPVHFQGYEHKISEKTRELMRKLEPDWEQRFNMRFIEQKLLGSRVIGNYRELESMETASPIPYAVKPSTFSGGKP